MIFLTSTSDKLQIVTSAAVALDVHATFMDNNAGVLTAGRTNTAISTATTTDVVASPAASTVRNVRTLHARNKSSTTADDVTVRHTDGTTVIELFKGTLSAGQSLQYVDGKGFEVINTNDLLAVLYSAQTLTSAQQDQARANIAAMPYTASANIAVNGGMDVSQELGVTGATVANNTNKYILDGWITRYTHASCVITSQQLPAASFPSTLSGFQYAHRIQATTAASSLSNGDFLVHQTRIEGWRLAHLGWGAAGAKDIVVAFQFYSTVAGTTFIRLCNAAADRNYYHEFAVASGWNFVTFIVPGDTSGTWPKDNTTGMIIFVHDFGKDASPTATLDAWTATAVTQTTNSTNLLATNNNQTILTGFYMAPAVGAQLPLVADLPRLMRPGDEELFICQRYFYAWSPMSSTWALLPGQCISTTVAIVPFQLPRAMRTEPTGITVSAAGDFTLRDANALLKAVTTIAFLGALTDRVQINVTCSGGGLAAGNATILTGSASAKLFVTGVQL